MQIVSKETIRHYEDEITDLEAQLAELEPMTPHLQLAQMLRDEMVALMGPDGSPELSPQQIGELAYKNVLQKSIDKARDDLTARYEQNYRKELYDRVIQEVEETEGPTILADVRAKIEADPELMVELHASARKELGARAIGVVQEEITVDQQEIVDDEAERQLLLDHLDVQFALDRELDLEAVKIAETLEPGDKLTIYRNGDKDKRYPLVLIWTKDAKGKEGWVWLRTPSDTLQQNSDGYWKPIQPKGDVFVKVGVQDKDLESGTKIIQENKLVVGLPLVLITPKGGKISPTYGSTNYSGYSAQTHDFIVESTDFQTKDLVFTEGEYKNAKKKS